MTPDNAFQKGPHFFTVFELQANLGGINRATLKDVDSSIVLAAPCVDNRLVVKSTYP